MNELETRTRTSYLGIVAGFIGGALVGTVATLLLAPRSGADTRRRIIDRAERSRDTLERMANAAREGATAARSAFTTAMHEEAAHHQPPGRPHVVREALATPRAGAVEGTPVAA